MFILGIDPGSQNLGWGVLELDERGQLITCHQGILRPKESGRFQIRLCSLAAETEKLLAYWRPQFAVVEKIFLGKNADSAFKLGHIRGVCVVECHKIGAEIVEYTAREVKKVITGSGSADKVTVRQMLYAQLGIEGKVDLPLDASDALALAYSFFIRSQTAQILGERRQPNQDI